MRTSTAAKSTTKQEYRACLDRYADGNKSANIYGETRSVVARSRKRFDAEATI